MSRAESKAAASAGVSQVGFHTGGLVTYTALRCKVAAAAECLVARTGKQGAWWTVQPWATACGASASGLQPDCYSVAVVWRVPVWCRGRSCDRVVSRCGTTTEVQLKRPAAASASPECQMGDCHGWCAPRRGCPSAKCAPSSGCKPWRRTRWRRLKNASGPRKTHRLLTRWCWAAGPPAPCR